MPLGSGLLIVTALGAGYAVAKRRRNKGLKAINGLKGINAIILISALLLTMPSCKKNVETVSSIATEGVFITLDIDGGNSGSKVNVVPNDPAGYATVKFEDGDVIYVGYDNNYVGSLSYTSTGENTGYFSGDVSIASVVGEQPLHVYFLGGKGFSPVFDGNTATVNISDQTEKYPVISYNHSNEPYTGEGSYSAKLISKCSIMKFNVTTPSTAAICITGMNNKVIVDFTTPSGDNNGFSYDKATTEGVIKMSGGSGSPATKWAIVLPQNELTTTGDAYSEDCIYFGTLPTIHQIEQNKYYHDGDDVISLSVNTTMLETPLTFETKTANCTVMFQLALFGSKPTVNKVEYNVYDGNGWQTYDWGANITLTNIGDKVSFRGTNNAYANNYRNYQFSCSADCYIYGNIMSLISKEGYPTATELNTAYTFPQLFYNNTHIVNHPFKTLVLPATTLANDCYNGMFSGCTSLTTAPALPATTLVNFCYTKMFNGCSSLNSVTCLATDISAQLCTSQWLNGVPTGSGAGTFTKAATMSSWTTGISGIPFGWTVKNQ